jgi:NADP-dependent 3-hydroxy acid dehydrogenase YdfG
MLQADAQGAHGVPSAGYRVGLLARRADRISVPAAELGENALSIEADVTDRNSLIAAA